jgi:signal transduction histidine kinase
LPFCDFGQTANKGALVLDYDVAYHDADRTPGTNGDPMNSIVTSPHAALLGIFGLLLSILGLAAAVVITMDDADTHFQRGELSQAQFGAILAARTAMLANDERATRVGLSEYRRLTDIESMLPAEDERAQARERDVAGELEKLLPHMAQAQARAKIDSVVSFTVNRENAEARYDQQEMRELRTRARWLTAALTIMAVASGVLGGVGLLLKNRRLSSEVARRTADLSAIDASRRLFFAKTSHELRTPITVMRMEAEFALSTPGAEEDALRQVMAQADFVEHRIAELLALARADDGQLQLSFLPCDLGEIAVDAVSAVQRYAESHAVTLRLEQQAPVRLIADRRWLAQAIVAVLDNAIKFSSENSEVEVRVANASVTITDSGIGLLPDHIPRIFDAFYQTDASSNGGSGLGLALARWVVEQHGGTIAAQNLNEGGCRIILNLPGQA